MMSNVVYSVEKSYVDNLEAWKFLDLNLLRTSLEFLIDQKIVNSVPIVNSIIVSNPMFF